LRELGVKEYSKVFRANGYDSLYYLLIQMKVEKYKITDIHLQKVLGISKIGHRRKIVCALQKEADRIFKTPGLHSANLMSKKILNRNRSCQLSFIPMKPQSANRMDHRHYSIFTTQNMSSVWNEATP